MQLSLRLRCRCRVVAVGVGVGGVAVAVAVGVEVAVGVGVAVAVGAVSSVIFVSLPTNGQYDFYKTWKSIPPASLSLSLAFLGRAQL